MAWWCRCSWCERDGGGGRGGVGVDFGRCAGRRHGGGGHRGCCDRVGGGVRTVGGHCGIGRDFVEEGDDGGCGRSLEKRNARRNVNALLKNNAFTFKIFKSNDIIYVFHYTAMTREKIRKKHRGDASVKRREAGRVDKNMTSAQPGVSN